MLMQCPGFIAASSTYIASIPLESLALPHALLSIPGWRERKTNKGGREEGRGGGAIWASKEMSSRPGAENHRFTFPAPRLYGLGKDENGVTASSAFHGI